MQTQRSLRMVLGDQLSDSLSSLDDFAPGDVVLMAEVREECTYVRHHQKKIAFVLSAMRHFAERLRARGVHVDYVAFDAQGNTHSLRGELRRAVARHRPSRVVATIPGEWRLFEDMRGWQQSVGVPVELREDMRFLCTQRRFRHWAEGRRELRMEFFYREMRRAHGLLMEGDKPAGGAWNYDAQNRNPLPRGFQAPPLPEFPPDKITRDVLALVAREFGDHFGQLDGFSFPVTREEAELALGRFIDERLPSFGAWQDAMKTGAPVLYHALISPALNAGLLDPLTICKAAERAWKEGHAPLNAVEGFIRQILGWREYMRGVYWLKMPDYARKNALGATRPLPWFYWSGETEMNCLHQAIGDTRANAYAHHIQRLMITGNFALIAGLDPDEVDEWYLIVYADAYQWVEMPNVRGMALFADGGLLSSKPYAASAAYINRMSDYCRGCRYDYRDAVGERACPFNFLYWDFIARHERMLAASPRMAMPTRTLAKMDPARVAAMHSKAAAFLEAL